MEAKERELFTGDGKDPFSTYKVDSISPSLSSSSSFPSSLISFSHPQSGENVSVEAPSGSFFSSISYFFPFLFPFPFPFPFPFSFSSLFLFFSFIHTFLLIKIGNLVHQQHKTLDWQEQLLTAMMQDHCLGQGNSHLL